MKRARFEHNQERLNPEHIETCRQKMAEFLLSHEVDVAYARSLAPDERNLYLKNTIFRTEPAESMSEKRAAEQSDDVGIVVVKPELLPWGHSVVSHLRSQGFEPVVHDVVQPRHADWMSTYGYMLDRYPDMIQLYISHRALGMQPVLVPHLEADHYRTLLDERGIAVPDPSDRDMMFDRLFCGETYLPQSGLRSEVSRPALRQLGFTSMRGYASLFDPVDYFKDTQCAKVEAAFNGIHMPSDRVEKARNFEAFFGAKS